MVSDLIRLHEMNANWIKGVANWLLSVTSIAKMDFRGVELKYRKRRGGKWFLGSHSGNADSGHGNFKIKYVVQL